MEQHDEMEPTSAVSAAVYKMMVHCRYMTASLLFFIKTFDECSCGTRDRKYFSYEF